MISFRDIEPSDREWMTACRDPRQHPFTALSFTSLFSWRKTYGLTIAGDRDFFVIRSWHDNAYYCPCGDREKCRRFIRDTLADGQAVRLLYLTKEQSLEMQQDGFHILMRDDLSEYIAELDSLALREGHHASNSYKMKVRHFQKNMSYTVRPVTARDLPLLNEIAGKDAKNDIAHDEDVFQAEAAYFGPLGLEGCILETDAGQQAFILGYPDSQETFTMTMTKHDGSLPAQVTAVLVHELACQLSGKYRLINLEEDLGLPGLRRAKILYSPVDRLNVYEAIR